MAAYRRKDAYQAGFDAFCARIPYDRPPGSWQGYEGRLPGSCLGNWRQGWKDAAEISRMKAQWTVGDLYAMLFRGGED